MLRALEVRRAYLPSIFMARERVVDKRGAGLICVKQSSRYLLLSFCQTAATMFEELMMMIGLDIGGPLPVQNMSSWTVSVSCSLIHGEDQRVTCTNHWTQSRVETCNLGWITGRSKICTCG